MSLTDLKSRSHKILEAIIEAYTESAVPVGSEFLLERYRFGVSPATIRNVMAELEEQGLITHPHTSAGRVPTDRGYRYYVDLLMDLGRLRPDEEAHIEEGIAQASVEEPEELLEQAARLLAELTQEAGVVLVPKLAQGSFRHLELILMDQREIVGVLIASEGLIKHVMLELEEPVQEDELGRLERFLNQELAGMPLGQVHSYLERSLLETTSAFFHLYKRAMDLLSLGPFFQEDPSLILEGTSWIFEAPEFKDIERTRRLLKALERKSELVGILERDLSFDDAKLHIGHENRGTFLTDCTVAAASYRLRGGVTGALGILGPTRMDYPRVTALVGRMARTVTRAFRERE
ncbi:MAG: heat-inducible transcription repressor HrcA [Candidatus Omnitrophica bacterium]|nr:heat-inducible transcription repressor HrcA [Candidatus Omnitrophota bacterium]